ELLEDLRGTPAIADGDAFVDRMEESAAKWLQIVEEDLGYTNETDYNGFADWYTADAVDLEPYVTRVYEEIPLEHRPSRPRTPASASGAGDSAPDPLPSRSLSSLTSLAAE